MTQNELPRCLLITHAELGEALLAAVYQILGPQVEAIAISNNDLALPQLLAEVTAGCSRTGPNYLFSDFTGGSCDYAARKTAIETPDCFSISGVNLAMLLSFFTKRHQLQGVELQQIIAEAGKRGIQV
ncbi:MAG: hypothetical protein ISR91_08120 [Candidatus Delongbacteria bacterium]|nr:hypothetical protein [Candidatus Delongbacteria bacterium]